MGNEWKDLYKKPQERHDDHSGPLLIYNDLVVDHSTNPRNVGEVEHPDGQAVIGDPACGDQMKVTVKIHDNRIVDIKFTSNGCTGAVATSSMMTELAKGKTVEEALALTDDDIVTALGGIPEQKMNCSLMGVAGLREALKDFQGEGGVRPVKNRNHTLSSS